jgi:L-asparaginase II
LHAPEIMAQFHQPLVKVTRGNVIESEHYGSIVVADAEGTRHAVTGNPQTETFLRSSAKPFQALQLVEREGLETLGLSNRHLAIMAGSHSGEAIHVRAVSEILGAAHRTVMDLECGVHQPYDRLTRDLLRASGQRADARHHNCSGKHAGMLALGRILGTSLENYCDPDHPI